MSPPRVVVKAALGFLAACTWTVSSFLIVPRRHRASSSISLASEEATGEVLPNKYWVDIYKDETNKIPWDIGGAQPQVMEEAAENSFRGLSILDCGCGKGENAEHILSDQGGASSLVGFDLSPAAVAIARERKLKSAYFHAASATDLLSTNEIQERGPFDVALDSALLHCLSDEDAQRYVDGVAKLLKKQKKLENFLWGAFPTKIRILGATLAGSPRSACVGCWKIPSRWSPSKACGGPGLTKGAAIKDLSV